ncbi:MAG: hypothetical protein J1E37_03955 [Prevotella sp.]|nr:hypothetical protein [Prevotella sp.]
MMKTLRYSFVSMLMLICGSAFAQSDVTFDFDADYKTLFPTITGESSGSGQTYVADGEFNETTTSTPVSGVTVTVTASGDVANRNRIWASAPRLRMYDGAITIKAESNFKKLTMTVNTNSNLVAKGNTVNVGTLNVDGLKQTNGTIIWEGDANEVTMTIAGNTQFHKIVVSYDGSAPEPEVVEEINVAQALEIINALADAGQTTKEYKVKGYVVGTPDFQRNASGELYGNVNLDIADTKGGSAKLTVFRAKDYNNKNFTEETINSIKADDYVVFQGILKKYMTNGVATPELINGYLISVGSDPTSIDEVKVVNKSFEGVMYNTAGQVVNKSYKGLVIMNGKKFVNK